MDVGAAVLDSRWIWPPVVHKALHTRPPFCQVNMCGRTAVRCRSERSNAPFSKHRDPLSALSSGNWQRQYWAGSSAQVSTGRNSSGDLHLHMHLLPAASTRPKVDASGVAKLDLARLTNGRVECKCTLGGGRWGGFRSIRTWNWV